MEEIRELLKSATEEELNGIAKILDSQSNRVDDIIDEIWWNAQSAFTYLAGASPDYDEIVRDAAKSLKLDVKSNDTTQAIEIKIAQKVINTVRDKLTDQQKRELDEEMKKAAQKYDKTKSLIGYSSIFGALTAAQLSGFGVYLLSSTALGAISGAIGITLPFVVYTTMSSAIAVVIGPVGWIGMGIFAVWKLSGPNYKKTISVILYIMMLRSRPESE